jgi:solute carrier family 50 protein (sugar transporter)
MQRWDAETQASADAGPRNSGFVARRRQHQDPEGITLLREPNLHEGSVEITPQETLFLRVLVFWSVILIFTSWLFPRNSNPAGLVGLIVNLNLIAFYGAPLKTIQTVISEKNCASIHYETMIMNWINTSFWLGYGFARGDLVVIVPNGIGLLLGIAQGGLCLFYPRKVEEQGARLSLHELESDLRNPEEAVPNPSSPEEDGDKSQSSAANNPELV